MKDVQILVDADPLVYRVGFAAETRVWYLTWYDGEQEKIAKFRYAWRLEQFKELMNIQDEESTKQMVSEPEPLANCLNSVKLCMEDLKNQVAMYLYEHDQTASPDLKLFLTGSGNFRDRIATIKPYKGNRDRDNRPYWYKEIREYLIKRWGAIMVEGYEADDKVAMLQYQADPDQTIICTIDKDLRMVPGHHYNYHHKWGEHISELDGFRFFCGQLLTGDATDNIPGLYKVGKDNKLMKALADCHTKEEMWSLVKEAYQRNVSEYPAQHGGLTWQESVLENGRLLWMMRHEDDLWVPPLSSKSLKEYLSTLDPDDPDGGL